ADDRFQNASDFLKALDETPEGHETSTPTVARTRPPRRRMLLIGALAFMAAGAIGALWLRAHMNALQSRVQPAWPGLGQPPDAGVPPKKGTPTKRAPVANPGTTPPKPTPPPTPPPQPVVSVDAAPHIVAPPDAAVEIEKPQTKVIEPSAPVVPVVTA